MSEESNARQCGGCGAEIPAEAPHGLCPKCLLEGVIVQTDGGDTSPHAPEAPPIGRIAEAFPQLEIVELIGQGGMGFVYKARQPKLDRHVALKILPERLAGDAAFRERFEREGRVLASLSHPSIVTVYDFGEAGGFFYLMMEHIDGVNLRQAMDAGRFTPKEALAVVPGICDALQFAHSEGVLHRDIKPANILMDAKGRVKIADFGIAKIVGEPKRGSTLTASGYTLGTPHYMAPEQIEKPGDVDHRADIYSLGVVFYELLTGELPIGRFALPSDKSPVAESVDEIVLRALAKERERRQQSAGEMKTEVESATAAGAVRVEAKSPEGVEPKGEALLGARCHFSTPDRLRTLKGQISAPFSGSGEARLFPDCLSLVENDRRLTISLNSIRDISLGYFDWWSQKGEKIPFVSLTQDVNGVGHTITLTLREQWIEPLTDTARLTARWAEEIRKAVKAKAGKEPGVTPEKNVSLTDAPHWYLNLIIAMAFFTPLFGFLGAEIVQNADRHREFAGLLIGLGMAFGSLVGGVFCLIGALAFAHTRRAIGMGNLQALTERHPRKAASQAKPGPHVGPEGTRVVRRWSKPVIVGAVCNGVALPLAVLLLVGSAMMGPGRSGSPSMAWLIATTVGVGIWAALAIAGIILGVVGVRNIDASGGRLRSRELAMWCAWFWPVVAPVTGAFWLSTRGVSAPFLMILLSLWGLLLMGLWHLTKRPDHVPAPVEPQTASRMIFLSVGAGVIAAIAATLLTRSGGVGAVEAMVILGLVLVGCILLAGFGALVWKALATGGRGERNPWGRRIFFLILCVFVVPPTLLLVAWLVPALAYQGARSQGPGPSALEVKDRTARVKIENVRMEGGKLEFDYSFKDAPELRGWLIVREWSGGGETGKPERFEGETTSVLNESGTRTVDLGKEIEMDQTAHLQALVGIRNVDGRGKNLELGQTFGLLDFSNNKGQRLTVAVEMRPKPVFGAGLPGFQIYVRGMDVRMQEGIAELKYEVMQSVEGYELLLESENAEARAVHPDGRTVDLPEPRVQGRTTLHRLGDRSWRTLRWMFPVEHANDVTEVSVVTGSRLWGVDADSSPTLFEVRNDSQGRLHSARLLMVPVEKIENEGRGNATGAAGKRVQFDRVFELHSGGVAFHSKTPFAANESLRAYLVRADGGSEEQVSQHDLRGKEETTEMETSGHWNLAQGFGDGQVADATGQFREQLDGGLLLLPANEAVRVFTVTNAVGTEINGELQLVRKSPVSKDARPGAILQTRSRTISGEEGIMWFFTSGVPAGWRLHARAEAPRGISSRVSITESWGNPLNLCNAVWHWPESLGTNDLDQAMRQLNRFKGANPLLVEPGRPAEAFAVTNASGQVFRGLLELAGPDERN